MASFNMISNKLTLVMEQSTYLTISVDSLWRFEWKFDSAINSRTFLNTSLDSVHPWSSQCIKIIEPRPGNEIWGQHITVAIWTTLSICLFRQEFQTRPSIIPFNCLSLNIWQLLLIWYWQHHQGNTEDEWKNNIIETQNTSSS